MNRLNSLIMKFLPKVANSRDHWSRDPPIWLNFESKNLSLLRIMLETISFIRKNVDF